MNIEETRAYLMGLAEQSNQAETHAGIASINQESLKEDLEPYAVAIGGLLEDSKNKLSEIEAIDIPSVVDDRSNAVASDIQEAFHIMWGLRIEVGAISSITELEGLPVQNVPLLESVREKWTQAQRILHDPAASRLGRDQDTHVKAQFQMARGMLGGVEQHLEEAVEAYRVVVGALEAAQTELRASYDHIGTSQDLLAGTKEQINSGRDDLLRYRGML